MPDHPRASQVKEKFGTLRFYLDNGTQEMYKLVREAERESAETCEDCGQRGEWRQGGWVRTLCDDCEAAYQKEHKRAWYREEAGE
jgi:hypothetical protein